MQPSEQQQPSQDIPSVNPQPQVLPVAAVDPAQTLSPQQPIQSTQPQPMQQSPVAQTQQLPASEPTIQEGMLQPRPAVAQPQQASPASPEQDQPTLSGPTDLPAIVPIQWQAAEYQQHQKSPVWYIVFGFVILALIGAALFFQAWTFVVLVPVMAVALIMYTHHPPQIVGYAVSDKGVYVNDTLHPMGEFRSFGIIQENNVNTLVLIPVKRFRPSLQINFPSEIGEALVDALGSYVPMKDISRDAFDKILRKLHI